MNDRSKQREWLEQVQDSVEWKLKGPSIQNPFDSAASDSKLEEYAGDRTALMVACEVIANMDETTIMKISDLASLNFETEHPNLVGIEGRDLDGYLRDSGVWTQLNNDFDTFQEECRLELQKRKG